MSQIKTKTVKITTVMRQSGFVAGFRDARAGKPFRYDAFVEKGQHWSYERGRIFGLLFHGELKIGQKITGEALREANRLFKDGTII